MKQRKECVDRFQAGDASAGERLLASSLGQVYSAAIRNSGRGIPIDDLVQEGFLGVVKAAMLRTKNEISFVLRVTSYIKSQIDDAVKDYSRNHSPFDVSIDIAPLSPVTAMGLITICGSAVPRPIARSMIDKCLDTLTPRQAKVIRLRFGLDDGQPRTLEEVGRVFNVTRERIRAIEAHAIRRMRHPSRINPLKDSLRIFSFGFLARQAASFVDPHLSWPKRSGTVKSHLTEIPLLIPNKIIFSFTHKERRIIFERLSGISGVADPRLLFRGSNGGSRCQAACYNDIDMSGVKALESRFIDMLDDPKLKELVRKHFESTVMPVKPLWPMTRLEWVQELFESFSKKDRKIILDRLGKAIQFLDPSVSSFGDYFKYYRYHIPNDAPALDRITVRSLRHKSILDISYLEAMFYARIEDPQIREKVLKHFEETADRPA